MLGFNDYDMEAMKVERDFFRREIDRMEVEE